MAQTHQIEVRSPALDAFLTPDPPRRLLGRELQDRLAWAFAKPALEREPMRGDNLPARILVCWRLARAAALVIGLCAEDESLDQATEIDPSPWTNPTKPQRSPAAQQLIRKGRAGELYTHFEGGLPLLPPKAHPDVAARWCSAMRILARDLAIGRSKEGQAGLDGLLDPERVAYAGVTEANVLALEELLVDEAQKLIIECGERAALDHFRTRYGFARKEAIGLIRLARADALVTGSSSIEEDRAIMVANLKDLVARCKEEMNSDKELRALKELARVQGLTRSEPEDIARTFMNVIGQVASRQDARVLDAHAVVRELPERASSGRPSEYMPVEEAEEAEDAEEVEVFERENAS